jgi:hypothetical protein
MKNLLILLAMGTTMMSATAPVKSKGKFKEVKETKTSAVFNVSADKVWQIVGPGFDQAHVWSRAVDHSTTSGTPDFEGATCSNRSCDLNASGFNKISETIIEYNESQRRLGYTVDEGLPGFVTYMSNNWRVIEVGPNQSQIEMTIKMQMKPFMGFMMGGMFKKNIDKVLNAAMEDLQIYSETGEISQAKKERINELADKAA